MSPGTLKRVTRSGLEQRAREYQMISSGILALGHETLIAKDENTINSIITVGSRQEKNEFALNPYQAKNLKHQLRRDDAPDAIVKSLDKDRLNENVEDFLYVNQARGLALEKASMKPR